MKGDQGWQGRGRRGRKSIEVRREHKGSTCTCTCTCISTCSCSCSCSCIILAPQEVGKGGGQVDQGRLPGLQVIYLFLLLQTLHHPPPGHPRGSWTLRTCSSSPSPLLPSPPSPSTSSSPTFPQRRRGRRRGRGQSLPSLTWRSTRSLQR